MPRVLIYHGYRMKTLLPELMAEAQIIDEPDDDAPAPSAPVQMPLMVLPEHVRRAASVRMRGHAGAPGGGPAGETCGSCAHYRSEWGGNRRWPKCALKRGQWTHGKGSDIRRKDPACRQWQRPAGASGEV